MFTALDGTFFEPAPGLMVFKVRAGRRVEDALEEALNYLQSQPLEEVRVWLGETEVRVRLGSDIERLAAEATKKHFAYGQYVVVGP